MTQRILLVAVLSLYQVGCATARAISGPDGSQHQLITCGAIHQCYEKATEVCGGKYKIVNTSNHVGGAADGVSTTTNLLVKCGE